MHLEPLWFGVSCGAVKWRSSSRNCHLGSHVHGYANLVNTHVIQSINNDPALNAAGLSAANLIFNNPPLTPPQFTRLRQVITGALNWLRNFLLNNPVQINKGYNVDEDFDPESKDQDKFDKRAVAAVARLLKRPTSNPSWTYQFDSIKKKRPGHAVLYSENSCWPDEVGKYCRSSA